MILPERFVPFERVCNFRDLGGYPAAEGKSVLPGLLYRSDSLAKFNDADWARFQELGVGPVIDLRYPWEISAAGRVRDDERLRYVNLSIEHRPYNQASLGPDVEVVPYLAERFAEVAYDGTKELRAVLETVADATEPVVFHCASGKDRTGIVASLLLTLLGVAEADIEADFALTSLVTEQLAADWQASHPNRTLVWPGYGHAPAELIRAFLAGLARDHGSVLGYLGTGLGVDAELTGKLRARLLG